MLYGWELLSPGEEDLIARGVRDGGVYAGPFHLVLFPTDRCNLDCFFCYTEGLRRTAAELEWPVLRRTLEEGAGAQLKGVSFGGGGEPFLYRHLRELLDVLDTHNLSIDAVKTNGTPLTPKLAAHLVRRGLRLITVSLNEASADAYSRMNRCAPHLFDRAISGIRAMVEARNAASSATEISVQVFAWRENYRQLPGMIEPLLQTGADLVFVNTIDGLAPELHMDAAQRDALAQIVREIMAQWPGRIQLNLAGEGLQALAAEEQHKAGFQLPDLVASESRVEYCYMPWYAAVIAASGDVFPCCHFATNPHRSLGNLHSHGLGQIWTGEAAGLCRREMRELMLAHGQARLLNACPRFIDRLCMGRSDCAFNYYLASPEFYMRMHDWAEGGPRRWFRVRRELRRYARGAARRARAAARRLLQRRDGGST